MMNINIDSAIFIGFLLVNLIVGLSYGRGVHNIKDYALGGRNFSTGTIAATLVATWIGGGFFAWNLSKAFSDGLPFITAVIGNGLSVFIVGYLYSPRLAEFLGCNSVAEVMGNLYGKYPRMLTSLAAIGLATGYAGLQIKVLSNLINWSIGIEGTYATAFAAIIVITYSTFGGIRSVTFTDVIQFLTFGAFVPALSLVIWGSFENSNEVVEAINSSPQLFDYHSIFTISWLTLFLWMVLPGLDPAMFQRILIARNISQVRSSFILASVGCIVIICVTSWIGLLVFAKKPNIDPDQIINYIIQNYSYAGLRGFTMIGIAAMVMSTVDSYINSAAVVFANDLCTTLGVKIETPAKRLLLSRCFAFIMGLFALLIALSYNNIFDLTLLATNFYMPIVTVPLTLAIFGFRSTGICVLSGMISGFCTVIVWRYFYSNSGIDSAIPAMFVNLITLLGSHYFLKQKGGFVGIKDKEPLQLIREERRKKLKGLISSFKQFNMFSFFKSNTPKEDYVYTYVAIFSIISVFSTIYTLPQSTLHSHPTILSVIYHTVLIISTIFLTYPIWPSIFRNRLFMSIFWNVSIIYTLLCVGTTFILITNFGQFQLMMLVLNIFVLSSLIRWQVTLITVPLACIATIQFYKWYINVASLTGSIGDLQFKIIYSLLLVCSALIGFVKPKQEYQALTEEKNEHLSGRIGSQEKQLREALVLRSEFIRNVQHEYHAPMTGITGFAELLSESYDKLTDAQRKLSIDEILKSSRRLDAFDSNISSLSVLSKAGYELNLEKINFSDLLHERVATCRKLYEENKEAREFDIDIEGGILINGDRKYLIQALDNLIINALTYCKAGKITIYLERFDGQVHLNIIDEGIGIPEGELENIFDEFTVSSKTRTIAGNRGVGLALCRRVVEVHGGKIEAKSDGDKGATFRVVLSL